MKSKDLEDCEKIIERSIVAVKDIDRFVNTVITERKLNPEHTIVQIGFDDGQQLLKLMMTIKEDSMNELITTVEKVCSWSLPWCKEAVFS